MTSRELMRAAMRRLPTPRIPVMPQLCHDTAVRIHAPARGVDWIDATKRCLEEPALVHGEVTALVREIGADGIRLFAPHAPAVLERAGDDLVAFDRRGGRRIGRVDLHGGGAIVPDHPEPPVETLEEIPARLERMFAPYGPEGMEAVRRARALVPDLFVASSPVAITMNTYSALRGRERAMVDLYDHPDFVTDALKMQVETSIRAGEALLPTGIDAFYIGDPSASASLIGPAHFERFFLPAYRAFCDHFRGKDILIYIHICGNSRPILELMAATGAHVVEPLDPLGGVSVADAKRRIGGRVALMGGVSTLTLARGSPEDVRAEAVRVCREGGPQGYVLAAGDMVPPATPLANLQMLVDVATKSLWRESA